MGGRLFQRGEGVTKSSKIRHHTAFSNNRKDGVKLLSTKELGRKVEMRKHMT